MPEGVGLSPRWVLACLGVADLCADWRGLRRLSPLWDCDPDSEEAAGKGETSFSCPMSAAAHKSIARDRHRLSSRRALRAPRMATD